MLADLLVLAVIPLLADCAVKFLINTLIFNSPMVWRHFMQLMEQFANSALSAVLRPTTIVGKLAKVQAPDVWH